MVNAMKMLSRQAAQRKLYLVWFLAIVLPFALLFLLFGGTSVPPREASRPDPFHSYALQYRNYPKRNREYEKSASQIQKNPVTAPPTAKGSKEIVKSTTKSVEKLPEPAANRKGADKKLQQVPLQSKSTVEDEPIQISKPKRRDTVKRFSDDSKKTSLDEPAELGTDITLFELDEHEFTIAISEKPSSRNSSSKNSMKKELKRLDVDIVVPPAGKEKANRVPTKMKQKKSGLKAKASSKEKQSVDEQGSTEGFTIDETATEAMTKAPQKRRESEVQCDLSMGRWIPDPKGPLYSNETCAFIQGHQNCLKNGRRNTEYLYWRWKPNGCELKRFEAITFLTMMQKKAMAFVGDSIARNQMQSLLCLLTQVESPKLVFRDKNDQTVTWHFASHNFTLSVFWAPYLIKEAEDEANGSFSGIKKLHLDVLEKDWTSSLPRLDVVVLSTGPWFMKQAIYLVKGRIIGCHDCSGANNKDIKQIGFYNALRAATSSVLRGVTTLPGYKGVTLFQTLAVDHFENGRWDTGGSCPRTQPIHNKSMQLEGVNKEMYTVQLEEFNKALKEGLPNGSKLKIVDTTYSSLLRPDGHPDQFRSLDSIFFDKNGSRIVPSDCLHWCLPGPIDTWNEFLSHILQKSDWQFKKLGNVVAL